MNRTDRLRVAIVGLAATHVAGLLAGHGLPWTGTLTMAAFLLYVWDSGPALRIGFAALAGLALSIDLRTGGTGFPNAFIDPGRRALEGTLVAVAVVALVRSRRWTRIVAAAVVVLLAGPVMLAWARPEPATSLQSVMTAQDRDDLIARVTASERLLHPGQNGPIAIAVKRAPARPVTPPPAPQSPLPAMILFAALALAAQARLEERGPGW